MERRFSFEAKDQEGNDLSEEIEAVIRTVGLDRIAPGRYSALLVLHLFGALKAGRINPFRIGREIEALDQGKPTGLKPPIQNKYPPLKGLWHKHYMQADLASLAINIRHGLKEFEIPAFRQMIREAKAAGEVRYVTPEHVPAIVHDVVHGNWERLRRDERLTGEWIIFAKHEGQNFYLCLGTHDKSTHAELRQHIDSVCCREFPFLANLLADGEAKT